MGKSLEIDFFVSRSFEKIEICVKIDNIFRLRKQKQEEVPKKRKKIEGEIEKNDRE